MSEWFLLSNIDDLTDRDKSIILARAMMVLLSEGVRINFHPNGSDRFQPLEIRLMQISPESISIRGQGWGPLCFDLHDLTAEFTLAVLKTMSAVKERS